MAAVERVGIGRRPEGPEGEMVRALAVGADGATLGSPPGIGGAGNRLVCGAGGTVTEGGRDVGKGVEDGRGGGAMVLGGAGGCWACGTNSSAWGT